MLFISESGTRSTFAMFHVLSGCRDVFRAKLADSKRHPRCHRPSAKVTRIFNRCHARGLIAKIPIVSVDSIASNIGLDILTKGGNAVDAAVATAFALAVTWPAAGNLGGGGYMLIYLKNGEVTAIDYREKAPEKATPRMFLNDKGEVDATKSGVGYLVIGVPGTVKGLWEASRRHGELDWKMVVEPAMKLARDGFVVDDVLARSLQTQASVPFASRQ